jgi:AcrR family transcriptional regulator
MSVAGLSGVTIGRLAEEAALSKSGLFAHFRSKGALQMDLLDAAVRLADAHVVAPAMAEAEGLPRLRALIGGWFGWPGRAGLPGGCPLAAALFELDDETGALRDHLAGLEARWRTLLEALVRRAAELGQFDAETDAAQFVWELGGIYLAHHAASRFLRDPAADARARRALDALFRRAGAPGFAA